MACATSPCPASAAAARTTLREKRAALQPRPQARANEMPAFAFRGRGRGWPMGGRGGGKSQRAKGRPDAGTLRVVSREARAQAGTGWWSRSPGPWASAGSTRPLRWAARGGRAWRGDLWLPRPLLRQWPPGRLATPWPRSRGLAAEPPPAALGHHHVGGFWALRGASDGVVHATTDSACKYWALS